MRGTASASAHGCGARRSGRTTLCVRGWRSGRLDGASLGADFHALEHAVVYGGRYAYGLALKGTQGFPTRGSGYPA